MTHYKAIDLQNCCLGTVSSRADRSVRASFETPELTVEQSAILLSLHGINARILIEPDGSEGVEEVKTDRDTKSASERMYAVIFKIWQTNPLFQDIPFETWRQKKMNTIIDHLKTQIKQS